MNKKHLPVTLLFSIILCLTSFDAFASDIFYFKERKENNSDSLVIKNIKNDKVYVVHKGDKIKLWWGKSYPLNGYFKSMNNDTLVMTINNVDNKLLKDQIEKLQIFSEKKQKRLGWTFIILGACIAFFVGLTGAALGAMMGNIPLAILFGLISSIPGLGVMKLGSNIKARKFKTGKKWKLI